jgi:Tfp pilus assembly protein PilV
MRSARRRGERGMTLVEVLIAFLILFVVTLSVLQLFSLALAVNLGSLARTDLTYRAQRAAETIRWVYAYETRDPTLFTTLQTQSGIDLGTQQGTTVTLPATDTDAHWSFWGPAGAAVVDENAPFIVSYQVDTLAVGGRWRVTVTARPQQSGVQYAGSISGSKAVRYVAIIP